MLQGISQLTDLGLTFQVMAAFLHFGGAQSEVCCLLVFPGSRRAWGKYGACWAPGSVKGKGTPPSGDNFGLDGQIPLGHIITVREVPSDSGTGVIS